MAVREDEFSGVVRVRAESGEGRTPYLLLPDSSRFYRSLLYTEGSLVSARFCDGC